MSSIPAPALVPTPAEPAPDAARPRLTRSATDSLAGGVCGGLGAHTGVDAVLWRVGFAALTLAGGSGVLAYLLLWVLVPAGPRATGDRPGPVERTAQRLHLALRSLTGHPARH